MVWVQGVGEGGEGAVLPAPTCPIQTHSRRILNPQLEWGCVELDGVGWG